MKVSTSRVTVKNGWLRVDGEIVGSNRTQNKFGMPSNVLFAEDVLPLVDEVEIVKGMIVFSNWPKSDGGDA